VGKGELGSAFTAAQERDSSLTIDIDELLSQLDANGDGSLDQDELGSLLDYVGQAAARRSSARERVGPDRPAARAAPEQRQLLVEHRQPAQPLGLDRAAQNTAAVACLAVIHPAAPGQSGRRWLLALRGCENIKRRREAASRRQQ